MVQCTNLLWPDLDQQRQWLLKDACLLFRDYGSPRKASEMEVEKMIAPGATRVYHVPTSLCLIRLGTRGRRRGIQNVRRIRASLGGSAQGQLYQRRTHYARQSVHRRRNP